MMRGDFFHQGKTLEVSADPWARIESWLRNKPLRLNLCPQFKNGTRYLAVSYLTCPIARFLICRSTISPSPGLTWALNEMKYRKAVGALSQERFCRSCVFAPCLMQLPWLLLFMTSTRWIAGTAKQSLTYFPTFPFVCPFEIWKTEARTPNLNTNAMTSSHPLVSQAI